MPKSEGPLGTGEVEYPKNKGNALLTTRSLDGKAIENWLWLANFATDLNLQIDTAQLRSGLSYRPIRMAERSLVFTALWNVRDRDKYLKFVKNIRTHWAYNLNEDQLTPMTLAYYGANKTWNGFVENANVGYAVTDVILSYDFKMRLIMKQSDTVAEMLNPVSSPLSVYAADVYSFPGFYKTDQLYYEAGLERLGSVTLNTQQQKISVDNDRRRRKAAESGL